MQTYRKNDDDDQSSVGVRSKDGRRGRVERGRGQGQGTHNGASHDRPVEPRYEEEPASWDGKAF